MEPTRQEISFEKLNSLLEESRIEVRAKTIEKLNSLLEELREADFLVKKRHKTGN